MPPNFWGKWFGPLEPNCFQLPRDAASTGLVKGNLQEIIPTVKR